MRTREEINDDRRDHGMIGTLEAVVELLFDIRNILLSSHASQTEAARLDDRQIPEDAGP